MLSLHANMLALNANRQLGVNKKQNEKTTEKLSSGYRINRAADDAAGLAMSEKMRRQIRGLHQAADNIQDGVGYVQTAEGALNEVHDMMQRMTKLAIKASNGTCTPEDRAYIDDEIQDLKEELDRIFATTTFNEQKIWDPREKIQIGTEKKQAVTFIGSSYSSKDVTNSNCDVLAYGGYTINATEEGVTVSWMGYDGKNYETSPTIDWETLKENNYSFDMSDYFGEKTPDNLLYDNNGDPVFKNTVSFQPQETATVDDIIKSINGVRMSSSYSASMRGRFEDHSGNQKSYDGVSVDSVSLNYSAAYASQHNAAASGTNDGHDFDAGDDTFLEPSNKNGNLTDSPSANSVADAQTSQEGWTFSFEMAGIGKVTATSSSVSYRAPWDTADDDEGYWWNWYRWRDSYGTLHEEKSAISRSSSEHGRGTLGSVMAALTGAKGTSTPGLLTSTNGGDCDNGGYIDLSFNLTADNAYTYAGNQSSTSVGSFTLRIRVNPSDTEETVLKKINDALNPDTVLDFYTDSSGSDSNTIYRATANNNPIDVPLYGGICNINIQAGSEAGQQIPIIYDSLSIIGLGLSNTNTLSREASLNAIDEIKTAMKVINSQRSDFGSYQNRLEHAHNVNKNSEENTQAAESVIRDTDMSKTMVEYSNNNILLQAGTAMLAQANQQPNLVLQLLQ